MGTEELARYIRSQRPIVARHGYPPDVRSLVREVVRARRTGGGSWRVWSDELGLPIATLTRWCGAVPAASMAGFVRVVVRESALTAWSCERPAQRVLVLPNGVQIRGLTLCDVLALVKEAA
jgi:hypothetical protein